MRFRKFLKPYKTRGSSFREHTYKMKVKNRGENEISEISEAL